MWKSGSLTGPVNVVLGDNGMAVEIVVDLAIRPPRLFRRPGLLQHQSATIDPCTRGYTTLVIDTSSKYYVITAMAYQQTSEDSLPNMTGSHACLQLLSFR